MRIWHLNLLFLTFLNNWSLTRIPGGTSCAEKLCVGPSTMLISDGAVVFGHWHAAKASVDKVLEEQHWPNPPEELTGGTVLQHKVSYLAPALNGVWDFIPVYPDGTSTCVLGGLFRHLNNFSDPAKEIMSMERACGDLKCNKESQEVLDLGVRFIGRYSWTRIPNYHELVRSNDVREADCMIGTRDIIRTSLDGYKARELGGALLVEFAADPFSEYMYGRLWFTEDGKLRALLVYSNLLGSFADCRVGSQLLAPPLDFTDDDATLKSAVIVRNGWDVVSPALQAGAFERVLSFFPNRALPWSFFKAAIFESNKLSGSPVPSPQALLDAFDLDDERNKQLLREIMSQFYWFGPYLRNVACCPTLLIAFHEADVLPSLVRLPDFTRFKDAFGEQLPLIMYVLESHMDLSEQDEVVQAMEIMKNRGFELDPQQASQILMYSIEAHRWPRNEIADLHTKLSIPHPPELLQ